MAGVSSKSQVFHQMGTFNEALRNQLSNLGATSEAIAVPPAANSGGYRAMWMEMNIPGSDNSLHGAIWNFDSDPVTTGKGAYLPPNVLAWYPVGPAPNTLYVAASQTSTRVNINWYVKGPTG